MKTRQSVGLLARSVLWSFLHTSDCEMDIVSSPTRRLLAAVIRQAVSAIWWWSICLPSSSPRARVGLGDGRCGVSADPWLRVLEWVFR